MNFVGIDLHKKTISICVVNQEREILDRKRYYCSEPERIVTFFESIKPFRVVVEATASYEWLLALLEPMAERVVLAHPKKMRVIAESTRKSDKLDAQILAEFLALDMIKVQEYPTGSLDLTSRIGERRIGRLTGRRRFVFCRVVPSRPRKLVPHRLKRLAIGSLFACGLKESAGRVRVKPALKGTPKVIGRRFAITRVKRQISG